MAEIPPPPKPQPSEPIKIGGGGPIMLVAIFVVAFVVGFWIYVAANL